MLTLSYLCLRLLVVYQYLFSLSSIVVYLLFSWTDGYLIIISSFGLSCTGCGQVIKFWVNGSGMCDLSESNLKRRDFCFYFSFFLFLPDFNSDGMIGFEAVIVNHK